MEASAAWEIVDLGANSWEVVVGEAPDVAEQPAESTVAELRPKRRESRAEPADRWRARTDERLAAVERRLGDLDRTEHRLGDLERAHAEVERGLDERDAALREEIAEIYRHAQQRLADTEGKPRWRQRRHEIRLARLERDRKIRAAERRLEERSRESLDRIDREGRAVEEMARGARGNERRLIALVERIDAAEARLRSANDRAVAARCRALGHEPPNEL